MFVSVATSFVLAGSLVSTGFAADKIKLRLSSSGSATGEIGKAFTGTFGPGISSFANFEPHFDSTLFKQGTELEAIARGNLEMSKASAQELAEFIPEFSIFTAGYVHRDADHQVSVFKSPMMDWYKKKAEDELGIKLLAVLYLGRRQVNLRTDKKVMTPDDLAGVNLRMPGTEAWQFLGKALGASPTPLAFAEVYTALQTGAIDGQDNPLPTVVDKKFYEVTKQIILTSHLVDLNYVAISKKAWDGLSGAQQKQMQMAADDMAAVVRKNQLKKESDLVSFLEGKGLKIYEPNQGAFRKRVQGMYLNSDYAKTWRNGDIDKINSL